MEEGISRGRAESRIGGAHSSPMGQSIFHLERDLPPSVRACSSGGQGAVTTLESALCLPPNIFLGPPQSPPLPPASRGPPDEGRGV